MTKEQERETGYSLSKISIVGIGHSRNQQYFDKCFTDLILCARGGALDLAGAKYLPKQLYIFRESGNAVWHLQTVVAYGKDRSFELVRYQNHKRVEYYRES